MCFRRTRRPVVVGCRYTEMKARQRHSHPAKHVAVMCGQSGGSANSCMGQLSLPGVQRALLLPVTPLQSQLVRGRIWCLVVLPGSATAA